MRCHRYDNDCSVFSPQGRIFQVEYAMEAVNQGTTATVGLTSKDYTVLVSLQGPEAADTLALPQRKILSVNPKLGLAFVGLVPDAQILHSHLCTQCLTYNLSYIGEMPVARLMTGLAIKMQAHTNSNERRPFGVGLLVAGHDSHGAHLYQAMPSAAVIKCRATAIGARSQLALRYLERHCNAFEHCSKEELICHGIQAIRGPLAQEQNLEIKLAIVGAEQEFTIYDAAETQKYIEMSKRLDQECGVLSSVETSTEEETEKQTSSET
ncbi:proteasome subunit alpha type-1-like [Drosophila miranda]|uniref:proteasome subunit alpha type-1-like n=1 Tax=Drosophila miranda TaxID=7229 RepID=UPI0007E83062|nr:proteasome subunit alpha type-1-like [Drosophila miranda]